MDGDTDKKKKHKDKKGKKGKKGKDKKSKSKNKFHVNGVEYKIGVLCEFCLEVQAFVHCPECPDFLCEKCDWEKHRYAKRADHVRTVLTTLSHKRAVHLVKWPLRRNQCRQQLLRRCRAQFRRYYDSAARQYYYENEATRAVQWHKPYCLKAEELLPLPTPDFSAQKIQSMYRNFAALKHARKVCGDVVDKIWARADGRFYYHNNSKCPLLHGGIDVEGVGLVTLESTCWDKPLIMGSKDLRPLWTEDIAAMMIQGMWKAHLSRQFMMSLVRTHYTRVWHPMKGHYEYKNLENGHIFGEMPTLVGGNYWEPDDVREWTCEDVVLWIRRLGLKERVDNLRRFHVDGKLLLSLDWEDFVELGFTRSIEIKRVLLEYERLMESVAPGFFSEYKPDETELLRRGAIRQHHRMIRAAILIQGAFRVRCARLQVKRFKECVRIEKEQLRRERERVESLKWWDTKLAPDAHKRKEFAVGGNGEVNCTKVHEFKDFGKRGDYNSARGWGSWELGAWNGFTEARWHKNEVDASGISRKFENQLHKEATVIRPLDYPLQFAPKRLQCFTRKAAVDVQTTGGGPHHATMARADGPAAP